MFTELGTSLSSFQKSNNWNSNKIDLRFHIILSKGIMWGLYVLYMVSQPAQRKKVSDSTQTCVNSFRPESAIFPP